MNSDTPIRLVRLLGTSDAFVLESELELLATRLAKVYTQLPPAAQADAIVLGHSLSNLRRKIKLLQNKYATRRRSSFSEHEREVA